MFTSIVSFLSLITCFHANAAEQSSYIPLMLTFSGDLATTIRSPFLYRFMATYQHASQSDKITLQIQKAVPLATALMLHGLIAKPIDAIARMNPSGHDADALLEAAGILGIRTDGNIHEQAQLNRFAQAFVHALIKKEAVTRWCTAAQSDLLKTKCVPHKHADHPLNKLRYAIKWAHEVELDDHGTLVCDTAYQTGLMQQLYECMYSKALLPVSSKHARYNVSTNTDFEALQNRLFSSPTWYFYAALHNVFDKQQYFDLLYGNAALVQNKSLHPTRHMHMAFHQSTEYERTVYAHDHKPYLPYEITIPDAHGLTFKPLKAVSMHPTECPTKIYFSKLDFLLLATTIAKTKPAHVLYNFATPQTEVVIAPDAYQYVAKLPSPVRINLGTISPINAAQIEQQLELLLHRIYESTREFNMHEYRRFHAHLPASGKHASERQYAPVKKITFLNKDEKFGATITYAVIDSGVTCNCN